MSLGYSTVTEAAAPLSSPLGLSQTEERRQDLSEGKGQGAMWTS